MPTKSKGGGWSASGILETGKTDQAVKLQCNFAQSKNGAQSYTLQFNISRPDPTVPPTNPQIRPVADIEWTVEGNFVNRRVDITNGLSITGQAESVNVKLYDSMNNDYGMPIGSPSVRYNASVQVAPGQRPGTPNVPQYAPRVYTPESTGVQASTFIPPTLAANDSNEFPIPPDIGAVSVRVTAYDAMFGGPPTLPIDFQNIRVAHIDLVSGSVLIAYTLSDAGLTDWVPLTPGAGSIRLTNSSATTVFHAFPMFGIDG